MTGTDEYDPPVVPLRSQEDEDSMDGCNCFCNIFGCLCICTKKQTVKHRLIVLWVWTIILVAAAGCILYFITYRDYSFEASPLDSRIVSKSAYGMFCHNVKIDTFAPGARFNAWLLNRKPDTKMKTGNVEMNTTLGQHGYIAWGFYVTSPDEINVTVCGEAYYDTFMTIYRIDGKQNLEKWEKDRQKGVLCYECFQDSAIIYTGYCNMIRDYVTLYFQSSSPVADYSYFVLDNTGADLDIKSYVKFNMTRHTYKTNNYEASCLDAATCEFDLATFEQESVVFESSLSSSFGAEIFVDCIPNVTTYIAIVAVPGILSLLITIMSVCYVYTRVPRPQRPSVPTVSGFVDASERGPLVHQEHPPSYESLYGHNDTQAEPIPSTSTS